MVPTETDGERRKMSLPSTVMGEVRHQQERTRSLLDALIGLRPVGPSYNPPQQPTAFPSSSSVTAATAAKLATTRVSPTPSNLPQNIPLPNSLPMSPMNFPPSSAFSAVPGNKAGSPTESVPPTHTLLPQFGSGTAALPRKTSGSPPLPPMPAFDQQQASDQAANSTPPPPPVPTTASYSLLQLLDSQATGSATSAVRQSGGIKSAGGSAANFYETSLGNREASSPSRVEECPQVGLLEPTGTVPDKGSDLLSVLLRAPSSTPTAGRSMASHAPEVEQSGRGSSPERAVDQYHNTAQPVGSTNTSGINPNATEHLKKALFGSTMPPKNPPTQESGQGGEYTPGVSVSDQGTSEFLRGDGANKNLSMPDEPTVAASPAKKPLFSYVNPFDVITSSNSKEPAKRTSIRPSSLKRGSDLERRIDRDIEERPPSQPAHLVEPSMPEGARLPSTDFAIDVTTSSESMKARKEVPKFELTLKATDFCFHLGNLISTNKGYISYPRKDGPIRVLHKGGNRAKLNGHSRDVVELMFFKSTALAMSAFRKIGVGMLLLSVGADSKICIWELPETPPTDVDTIPYKSVLQINASREDAVKPRIVRAAWHPTDVDKFAISDDVGRVWLIDVVTLLDGEESAVINAEGDFGEIRGFSLVGKHDTSVTSVRWGPDGTVLASGDENGMTKLWNMDRGDGRAIPLRQFSIAPGDAVSFLAFAGGHGPSQPCRYMVVAQDRGRKVSLWDLKVNRPVHSFEFVGGNMDGDKEDFCVVEYESSTSTLILCHSARRTVMLMHVGLPSLLLHHHYQMDSNQRQKMADYIIASNSGNLDDESGSARFNHVVEVFLENPLVAVATMPVFAESEDEQDEETAAATGENTAFELYATDAQAVYILKVPGAFLPPGDPRVLTSCPMLETKMLPKRERVPLSINTVEAKKPAHKGPPAWLGAPDSAMSAFEATEREEVRGYEALGRVSGEGPAVATDKNKGKNVAFGKEAAANLRKGGDNSVLKVPTATPYPRSALGVAECAAEENQQLLCMDEEPSYPAGEKPGKQNKKQRKQQLQQQQILPPDAETVEGTKFGAPVPKRESAGTATSQLNAALIKEFRSMEANLTGKVGRWVTKEMEKQSEKYERDRQTQEKLAAARQETLLKIVSQTLTNNVGQLIQQTIRTEMKANAGVASAQLGGLEPQMEKALAGAVENALSGSFDAAIASSFQRCLCSSDVVEALSKNLAAVMQPIMVDCFRGAFRDILIPGYQRATTVMFEQMHQTFTEGVRELKWTTALGVGDGAEQQRRLDGAVERISEQFNSLHAYMASPAFLKGLTMASAEMEQNLVRSISREIRRVLIPEGPTDSAQPYYPASRRTSHASLSEDHLWRDVVRLAHFGEYDQAFIKALSSQDLPVVHRLCHAVSTQTVFLPGKALLSQPVLLSLLQQLSMDVEKDTNFKLGWIQESLMALRPKDPVIAEHVQRLMPDMRARLEDTYYNLASLEHRPEQTLQTLKFVLHAMHSMVTE